MTRGILITIAALALTACATRPVVQERVTEVSVPVAIKSIAPGDVPAVPAPLPPRPLSDRAAGDLLLAQVCALVSYALKADPLLRVSAGLPGLALPPFPECERPR